MSAKPAKRNWNDVQIAIATAAIVTTLGMWNLFASPAKAAGAQATDPAVPPTDPPTEPPTEAPVSSAPIALPYVKIIFTPGAPQIQPTSGVPQPQQPVQQKRKRRSNGGGGGGSSGGGSSSPAPVTQTKSS